MTLTDKFGRSGLRGNALVSFGTSPPLWLLTSAVIALAVAFGGGTRQGLFADAIVQLSSLLLLGCLVPVFLRAPASALPRGAILLSAAIILLPLVQLLPLPPSLWTQLPQRDAVAAAYGEAGLPLPWLPISLDPAATWRTLLSLLPPLAVFFAILQSGLRARRSLSLVVIALGIVGALLGFGQLAEGPGSPLRFFPYMDIGHSVGFFANRNHQAAFFYSLIPFVGAWLTGLLARRRAESAFGLVVCLSVFITLLLGLGIALSRAGIFLGGVAIVASVALVARDGRAAKVGLLAIGLAVLLGGMLVFQFAFFNLLGRFSDGVLDDYRVIIAQGTLRAVQALQPIGSGFGTFVPIYQMFDSHQALLPVYVNHAHNDWLEVWLEGGWAALVLLVWFLTWFARAAVTAWRVRSDDQRDGLDRALPQAASIVVLLLLLHSAVDYPLRTTALMTVFAFSLALLIPPIRIPSASEALPVRRERRRGRNFSMSPRHASVTMDQSGPASPLPSF